MVERRKGLLSHTCQNGTKVLNVCGTSVPSERIFSINDNFQSCMNPTNVDNYFFLLVCTMNILFSIITIIIVLMIISLVIK